MARWRHWGTTTAPSDADAAAPAGIVVHLTAGLAAAARDRGWAVHPYDAQTVADQATLILGTRAHDVLHGPRARLCPPWSKDHRMALAATIVEAG